MECHEIQVETVFPGRCEPFPFGTSFSSATEHSHFGLHLCHIRANSSLCSQRHYSPRLQIGNNHGVFMVRAKTQLVQLGTARRIYEVTVVQAIP